MQTIGDEVLDQKRLDRLRLAITENLRVQRDGDPIDYVNVGNALQDACAKQNHTIFARRGCGKTLLLHSSARSLRSTMKSVYLNCEDFKKHSFPNVLIEILLALFRELERNLHGWFGKKKKSKNIIREIMTKLEALQRSADERREEVSKTQSSERTSSSEGSVGLKDTTVLDLHLKGGDEAKEKSEIKRAFTVHQEKLGELDRWLPELKDRIRSFFSLSKSTEGILLQIDDLYHLKRTDQAFVIDYIHRLCKDVPLYFKVATLRHASTLYADRDGQPIGVQERHDYQPINIDYTFSNFRKTATQNMQILEQFGAKSGLDRKEIRSLFKGEGFDRLVMAGGGVPRDVLSLFLDMLSNVDALNGGKIGKDDVRIISRSNFERKIEELKQDSKGDEQDDLLKGECRYFCV